MRRVTLVLGLGALIGLTFTATALATHARPQSATPITVRLVPVFTACGSSNGVHGPPLALPSCAPPVENSSYLTMVAPDRPAPYNQPADGRGRLTLKVTCLVAGTTTETGESPPCPAPGDQADIKITFELAGIRCIGAAGQGNCAGGAGSLYGGELMASWTTQLTDHYAATFPNPPGPDCSDTSTCPSTAVDYPTDIGTQCSAGACNFVTSEDAWISGLIREEQRAVMALGNLRVIDGGLNGDLFGGPPPTTGICPPACAADGDGEAIAFGQGLFIP